MIRKIDHVVITTTDITACRDFYERAGFTMRQGNGRYELYAGDFKINVHIKGHELEPKAGTVQPGSADLCFEIDGEIEAYKNRLLESGLAIELGVVPRTGVRGAMQSVYLRDPDGNLIEFCAYNK